MNSFRRFILIAVALLLALVVDPSSSQEQQQQHNSVDYNDHVLVLNDENFDELKAQNSLMLVKFYAPWCVHCKSIAPGYSELAKKYEALRPDVKIAEVNATGNPKLSSQFNIQHYPTLLLFVNDKQFEYKGEPSIEKYMAWLDLKLNFPLKSIEQVSDLDAAKNERKVLFVGMFKENNTAANSPLAKLVDIASNNENTKLGFGLISDPGLMEQLEAHDNMIVAFKQFDEPRVELEVTSAEQIESFVKAHSIRLLSEFSRENAPDLFTMGVNLLLFSSGQADDILTLRKEAEATAKKYRGQIAFGLVDTDVPENQGISDFLSILKEDLPAVRLLNLSNPLKKYKLAVPSPDSSEINEQLLSTFIDSFYSGKLSPYFKSQQLPHDWDAGSVKLLVRDNFEQVAYNESAHVMVQFYAPWCGHCHRLAPVYDKLGDHFRDFDDVVIAKIDATENELDSVTIPHFPTLILFKAGSNEEVTYSSDRSLNAMIEFIDEIRGVKSTPPPTLQQQEEPSQDEETDLKHEEL